MKTIAIITPKIDTFSNPTLILLFEKLIDMEYKILFFGFEQLFVPKEIRSKIEFQKLPFNFVSFFKRPQHSRRPYDMFKAMKQYYELYHLLKIKNKVKAIVCVDPMGLVFAGRICKLINLKIIYASFEIFFEGEFLDEKKKMIKINEKKYSDKVDLVVIQDKKREELLRLGNNFKSSTRFLHIPVSPGQIEIPSHDYDIYEELNIPRDKKIVVYSGTLQRWCGIYELLNLFPEKWNKDFWLVLHSHYILDPDNEIAMKIDYLVKNRMNVSFHNIPFFKFLDYAKFLSKCDIGIALYFPNDVDFFAGKNIIEIGLSSGKFSTYMMLGIPTITTSNDIYKELNKTYNFGDTINDVSEISEALDEIKKDYDQKVIGCKKVYEKVLDPVSGIEKLVNQIEEFYK